MDEASLEGLKRNVVNAIGNLYAEAKFGEGGSVVLTLIERYRHAAFAAKAWPQYLEIADAAADFHDASVVLKKD